MNAAKAHEYGLGRGDRGDSSIQIIYIVSELKFITRV